MLRALDTGMFGHHGQPSGTREMVPGYLPGFKPRDGKTMRVEGNLF
ncbi:MAG: hypothetical protein HXS49_01625 [Theionarchaea archaeon]|nr:hypothetical protein [Theionarchaea archaeon]MBU7033857.1 hypothetical protein [Theionarchaea archaeon]